MRVIKPTPFVAGVLTSSSVTENDYPNWSSTTTYALGDRCIRLYTHRVHQSVIANNIGHDPALAASTQWVDAGPTNQWAMLDQVVGTATVATGTITASFSPGAVNSLAVVDTNAVSVKVVVKVGATTTYNKTVMTAAANPPVDGYTYSAADASAVTVAVFDDLPPDPAAVVSVTITGPSASGPVSVGTLLLGTMIDLGTTEAGAGIGITDYSRKETDDFGATTFVERGWAKTMTVRAIVPTPAVDSIQRMVASLRAKPALWLGEKGFDSLTVYGNFKDFSVDLTLANWSYVSLSIEGLI